MGEYDNTYHRKIKMKPIDVKNNTYHDSKKKVNNEDPKFKVGDHVRSLKYKNIFSKGYTPNWSQDVFVVSKKKIQFLGHMLLMILMVKKLQENFMKKNYRRRTKKI